MNLESSDNLVRVTGKRALTLVELLVVITIIVLLCALTAGVATRAIGTAKLAICAAGMDSVATGIVQYTMDNGRRYPVRNSLRMMTVLQDAGLRWTSIRGVLQSADNTQRVDDRPSIKPYMSIRNLLDPFCNAIDLDDPATTQRMDTWVFAPYEMWWDFQYDGFERMSRLGDGFSWQNPDTGKKSRWKILVADMNTYRGSVDAALSSHNDRDGRLVEDTELGTYMYEDGTRDYHSFYTNSGPWAGGDKRGPQDYNFAYDDGSVSTIHDVPAMAWGEAPVSGVNVRSSSGNVFIGNSPGGSYRGVPGSERMAVAPWAPWASAEWRPYHDGDYVLLPAQ